MISFFADVPLYQPERLVVLESDTPAFGAGAVIGKKHVSLLVEDALRDAGALKMGEKLPVPQLPPAFLQADFVEATKTKYGVNGKYAVLVPVCAANRPLKRWQPENFVEIAKRLLAQGITPMLIGGPSDDEKKLCADIRAAAGDAVIDVCGKTSLAEIAALSKGAQFTLGNDTGPTHIAAGSGALVYAFFAYYSDPATWQPRTPNNTAHVITGRRVQEIGVDQVWQVVGKTIETTTRVKAQPKP